MRRRLTKKCNKQRKMPAKMCISNKKIQIILCTTPLVHHEFIAYNKFMKLKIG